MSKETETTITLTLPELHDLWIILENCRREGWCYGRRDYWTKHLGKLLAETNKAIKYLEEK
jgi:hypothetical protein